MLSRSKLTALLAAILLLPGCADLEPAPSAPPAPTAPALAAATTTQTGTATLRASARPARASLPPVGESLPLRNAALGGSALVTAAGSLQLHPSATPMAAPDQADAEPDLSLRTVAFGRSVAQPLPAAEGPPRLASCASDPRGACAPRFEVARGALTEWWTNRPEGVEHGWTIAERPSGDGPVRLVVALEGPAGAATVRPRVGPDNLRFETATRVVDYAGLRCFDAHSAPVPCHFEEHERGFAIAVADADAVYPLVVDPILTSHSWSVEGGRLDWHLGSAVVLADFNGDGFDDVVVSARGYDEEQTDEGAVFLYLGSPLGPEATPSWQYESNQEGCLFGASLAAANVNGDAYADLIVGSPTFDSGQSDEGRVFVFHGGPAGLPGTPNRTMESDRNQVRLGDIVANAGDVNGDTYDDVLATLPWYANGNSYEGAAWVYYGSESGLSAVPDWTFESNINNARFGTGAAGIGDINGDTYDDIALGSEELGWVRVFTGGADGLSETHTVQITAPYTNSEFGFYIAGAGDVNGDTYDDLILGAPDYDPPGAVNGGYLGIHYGGPDGVAATADWTLSPSVGDPGLGGCVGAAGDFDADGHDDFYACAPDADGYFVNEGEIWIFRGGEGDPDPTPYRVIRGTQANGFLATGVSGGGDVNGDGYDDFIAGSEDWDGAFDDEGRADLYYGGALTFEAPEARRVGQFDGDAFGAAVAWAGDVNGDGLADLIVGAPEMTDPDAGEGAAYLYLGTPDGLAANAAWSFQGDQPGAALGTSVASAGDVNGDGYADVIVGAPGFDGDSSDEGAAFVFYGSPGGLTGPEHTYYGEASGSAFGTSVASAGDADGDGDSEVVVGAPGYDAATTGGRAYVYYGSPAGLSPSPDRQYDGGQANAELGAAVACAGDVDADGYSDLLVGAPGADNGTLDEGQALLFRGTATGLVSTPDWIADGDSEGARLGASVARAGDVDGDGYADVLVGAPGYADTFAEQGLAVLFLGSAPGLGVEPAWTYTGPSEGAHLGASVSTAGDIDGDGYLDVVVGSPGAAYVHEGEGWVWAFLGSATGLADQPHWTYESDIRDGRGGAAVTAAGDLDGDGLSEVVVGVPGWAGDGSAPGAVFVMGGPVTLVPERSQALTVANGGALFGAAVSTAGDLDGDGFDDLIVGAYQYSDAHNKEGAVFVYYGGPGGVSDEPDWQVESDQEGGNLGASVANVGDLDGDGYADLAIAAASFDSGQNAEGRLWVYYGSPTGLGDTWDWRFEPDLPSVRVGNLIADAGDLDRDGFSELVVRAYPSGGGQLWIFRGGPDGLRSGPSTVPDATIDIPDDAICFADLDGDGYRDAIVGEEAYSSGRGRVRFILGSAEGFGAISSAFVSGTSTSHRIGRTVVSVGDVNGDGREDVLAGGSGQAFLIAGAEGGFGDVLVAHPDSTGAPAGDVNGDGLADYLIALSTNQVGLFLGSTDSFTTTPALILDVPATSEGFGTAMGAVGDIDGDGLSDLAIGSPRWTGTTSDQGRVYLYRSGRTPERPYAPQMRQLGSATPIVPGLRSASGASFDIQLAASTPYGAGRVSFEYQVATPGGAFGLIARPASWARATTSAAPVQRTVSGLEPGSDYLWRARVVAEAALALPQSRSYWFGGGRRDIGGLPALQLDDCPEDLDRDGICDDVDPDDDGDTIDDDVDRDRDDPFVCADSDEDDCDDCSVRGRATPDDDGLDSDEDGECDLGDDDDDGDTVPDDDDGDRLDPYLCRDADEDGCDDCAVLGRPDPANDGPDGDGDGACDAGTEDGDGDGVPDSVDRDPGNRFVCRDADEDGCDDCSVLGSPDVDDDGTDNDGDGECDLGDDDDDGDTVPDTIDDSRTNAYVCRDVDEDGCDDCSVLGRPSTADDGTDTDSDGECDLGDDDDDNDGVPDGSDANRTNPYLCRDLDEDTCDDCSVRGRPVVGDDGPDAEGDGLCDAGDSDDDNDGVPDTRDTARTDAYECADADEDTCDDCAVAGRSQPGNDGLDTDGDGLCDAGDGDDDADTVPDGADRDPTDEYSCADGDSDGCDDCAVAGRPQPGNDGLDTDGDGLCDLGDGDDDGDGIDDVVEGDDDPDDDDLPNRLDPDSDGDGVDDVDEGTRDPDGDEIPNYLDEDSDDNGTPDGEELGDADEDGIPDAYDLDDEDGPGADPDEDGLSNEEEVALDTDPYDPDSDGDGIDDGTEYENGTDPLVPNDPGAGDEGEDAGGDAGGPGDVGPEDLGGSDMGSDLGGSDMGGSDLGGDDAGEDVGGGEDSGALDSRGEVNLDDLGSGGEGAEIGEGGGGSGGGDDGGCSTAPRRGIDPFPWLAFLWLAHRAWARSTERQERRES